MEVLKRKLKRLETLTKIEELSLQEVLAQLNIIDLKLEELRTQKSSLLYKVEVLNVRMRKSIEEQGFLDLQSHITQQKLIQKMEQDVSDIQASMEPLESEYNALTDATKILKSKAKGFSRMSDRYVDILKSDYQASEIKELDALFLSAKRS